MAKRKRRRSAGGDSLAEWTEYVEHGHVAGYWASVGKLPPAAIARAPFGCVVVIFGGMLCIAGLVGLASAKPGEALGALAGLALGGVLLWLGSRMLRRRRRRHT